MPLTFNFELDDFQKQAIESINKNNNVLVTAHTGSGKTVIAEYAIDYNLNKNNKAKVLFVSPIKSLSNEKYRDFTNKFTNYTVGILTGDNKINPDANIIIITAEILRNDLFIHHNLDKNISCVIFDEIHYINDQDRGTVWEEILVHISNDIQLIMLSATVANANVIASWLKNIKNKDIDIITTAHRIIPLTHYIFINDDKYKLMDNNNNYDITTFLTCRKLYLKPSYTTVNSKIIKLVDYLIQHNLLQTIIFSFSRNKCELYANIVTQTLITTKESHDIENIFNHYLHQYKHIYEQLAQYQDLFKLLLKGIAYHHSGLISVLKEIVEILFKRGLVKLLFATETFAVGVNMPTRTVVLTDIYKMTNKNRRLLTTSEYKQISGRAGRRGIDTVGNVLLLPINNMFDNDDLRTVLTGSLPYIKSKLSLNYSFIIKSIKTNTNTNEIFSKFLLTNEYILSIKQDYSLLETNKNLLFNFYKINITNEQKEQFNKYIKINNPELQNMRITLTKQQERERKLLNNYIKTNKEQYDAYINIINLEQQNNELEYIIKNKNDYFNVQTYNLINLIYEYNYISHLFPLNSLQPAHLTIKGNFGLYINECDCIILTEIITRNYLDNLTSSEIIAVLALFIDERENDNNIYNYYKQITNIVPVVDNINILVNELSSKDSINFTELNTQFILPAYMWANGDDINTIKQKINIYEGNFIRNITKINNIVHDIINGIEVINKLELLPKLQAIEPLLIRDIVTVNSLYISI